MAEAFLLAMMDTVFMKLRATLVGILTAILLSLSSAASACELRCDLARVGAPCHGQAFASPEQHGPAMSSEMPGMAMTSMQQKHEAAALRVSGDAARVVSPDACKHAVCSEKPLLLKDETTLLLQKTLSYQVVALVAALLWPKALSAFFAARGAPPLPPHTLVSLHTALRV